MTINYPVVLLLVYREGGGRMGAAPPFSPIFCRVCLSVSSLARVGSNLGHPSRDASDHLKRGSEGVSFSAIQQGHWNVFYVSMS